MSISSKRLVLALIAAALLITAGVSCQKKVETRVEDTSPKVDSVASADGATIHYDVRGAGDRALVFVHCWSCDRSYWDGQTDEFAKDYKVVTLDLAGHGESGMGREVWSMPAYGADVAAVVNKLQLKDVVLIGHSMGGAVSLEAARLLPGTVKAIVGVDTYQDLARTMEPQQMEQMMAPFRRNFAATTEAFVKGIFGPNADTSLANRIAKDMASESPEVGIGSFEQLFTHNPAEVLKEVRVPIRCINADLFPTDVEGNQSVAASFATKYMPGHGHFLHLEDPAGFNALLHETLAEFEPVQH